MIIFKYDGCVSYKFKDVDRKIRAMMMKVTKRAVLVDVVHPLVGTLTTSYDFIHVVATKCKKKTVTS